MNRRRFMTASALAVASSASFADAGKGKPRAGGPVLLTVTGAIGPGNRGPLDPALDQMMKKQGLAFNKAHVFDFVALTALPEIMIRPTLEYDAKPHALSGPLLVDVIKAAGAQITGHGRLLLRAVDGYVVAISMADVQKYRFMVATQLDGHAMPLGGLGPLWAMYDADRFPEMAVRPLSERFTLCPWALYHIEVQA